SGETQPHSATIDSNPACRIAEGVRAADPTGSLYGQLVIFRQLFDAASSTYTYLVADPATREAALIDTVREQAERDVQLVDELGLVLTPLAETHVHADHVTAAGLLRERTGARSIASSLGAPCVDRHVRGGDVVELGALRIEVLATPGHTDDGVSYRIG